MLLVMVDVEADGPVPGLYSMLSLAAVIVEPEPAAYFHACFRPISERYDPSVLKMLDVTRSTTLTYPEPSEGMQDLSTWLTHVAQRESPTFFSDNNGFDWSFVNYYFHRFLGNNPFGYQSYHLPSVFFGALGRLDETFREYRRTGHTHDPIDDARGNVEALLALSHERDLDVHLGQSSEQRTGREGRRV